jgi:hypothetical protein
MLNAFSWKEYLQLIGGVLAAYYLIVVASYYRREMSSFLRGRKSRLVQVSTQAVAKLQSTDKGENSGYPLSDEKTAAKLTEVLDSLFPVIAMAGSCHYPKEELMMALKLGIQPYKAMIGQANQHLLNRMILRECESHCAVSLTVYDFKQIWAD